MKELLNKTEEERRRIFDDAVARDLKKAKERRQRELDAWDHLKPFKNTWDVPQIPQTTEELYKTFYLPRLIKAGAIPKNDLIDGQIYIGDHRRCIVGKWNAKLNKFEYNREKWGGTIPDTCNHFEDDDGFALFTPIKLGTEEEWKINKQL